MHHQLVLHDDQDVAQLTSTMATVVPSILPVL